MEDGTVLMGCGFGAEGTRIGEVVFTTAMSGYVETLTDPSYKGQILVFSHPLIGNYGVPEPLREDGVLLNMESDHVQVEGVVVAEETIPSKWNSKESLHEWLSDEGVPAISGIDTRMLIKKLRENGSMMGIISSNGDDKPSLDWRYDEVDFTDAVSPHSIIVHGRGENRLAVVDCGVKHGILRELVGRGFTVVRVPCKSPVDEILALEPQGVIFSNGPGNPNLLPGLAKTFRYIAEEKLPILGICLGHQVAALAMGGRVRKMKFGHRAVNKPVVEARTGSCFVTTHNHGYGMYDDDVPPNMKVWFRNPDDGVVEGLIHEELPIFTTQFHPEARAGPRDASWIFDKFAKVVRSG
nr:glutamine-hydrolyzing carbamoyl-phosphate synthase small subunit [Thermocladium modestius]